MAETVLLPLTSNGEKLDGETTTVQTETTSGGDRIDGGSGNDVLLGEMEADSFAFISDGTAVESENGNDLIVVNEGDDAASLDGGLGDDAGTLDAATGFEALTTDTDAGGGPNVRVIHSVYSGPLPDQGDDAPIVVRIVGDSGADGLL